MGGCAAAPVGRRFAEASGGRTLQRSVAKRRRGPAVRQRAGPMRNQAPSPKEPPTPVEYAPLAALLSYLVPGLGQVSQGRVGKGVLFFVCVTSLFFYGMYLGSWSNVYLPD